MVFTKDTCYGLEKNIVSNVCKYFPLNKFFYWHVQLLSHILLSPKADENQMQMWNGSQADAEKPCQYPKGMHSLSERNLISTIKNLIMYCYTKCD